jgi:hypothetical protein
VPANAYSNRRQGYTTDVGIAFTLADDFNLLGGSPAWRDLMTPLVGLADRLADPRRRVALREQPPDIAFSFDQMTVLKTQNPDLKQYENLTVDEVAQREGKHPADAFCDRPRRRARRGVLLGHQLGIDERRPREIVCHRGHSSGSRTVVHTRVLHRRAVPDGVMINFVRA